MDDRRAHFLIMLGDACLSAGLADIAVEVLTAEGDRLAGVPSAQPTSGGAELNETGLPDGMLFDGAPLQLENVVEFVVRTP
jgi:hypothetical protein